MPEHRHVQPIQVGTAFEPPVDMSASGHPAGTTAVFSQDPVVAVPAAITLTIGNTGVVAAGTYPITVTGTDADESGNEAFNLTVDIGVPAATTLVAPADGATGVSTSAPLSWSAQPTAFDYDVQVDNNSDFSSPEYSATVIGTSHDGDGSPRPTPSTTGGSAPRTAAVMAPIRRLRSFRTSVEYCATVNIPILDNTSAQTTIVIPATFGTITDLDVKVVATHT